MSIDRRSLLLAAGVAAAAACAATPPSEPLAVQARRPQPNSLTGDVPAIGLRHAFSLSIFFKERIQIASVRGRVFVPAVGGEIWGPRLQGRVVPYGGADFAVGGLLDAHYMLQASDGALIYINNRGFMKAIGPRPLRVPRRRRSNPARRSTSACRGRRSPTCRCACGSRRPSMRPKARTAG